MQCYPFEICGRCIISSLILKRVLPGKAKKREEKKYKEKKGEKGQEEGREQLGVEENKITRYSGLWICLCDLDYLYIISIKEGYNEKI